MTSVAGQNYFELSAVRESEEQRGTGNFSAVPNNQPSHFPQSSFGVTDEADDEDSEWARDHLHQDTSQESNIANTSPRTKNQKPQSGPIQKFDGKRRNAQDIKK